MANSGLKYMLNAVHSLSPSLNFKDNAIFVTIGFSHFCERARWAMDLSPLCYKEVTHCPALHLSSTLVELSAYPRLDIIRKVSTSQGNGEQSQPSTEKEKIRYRKELTSVPKLVLTSNSIPISYNAFLEHKSKDLSTYAGPIVIKDGSTGIMQYLADLYPDEMHFLYPKTLAREVSHIEEFAVSQLAMEVTKWLFGNLILTGKGFDDRSDSKTLNINARNKFVKICGDGPISGVEKVVLSVVGKSLIIPLMIRNNDISCTTRLSSQQNILKFLDSLENLQKGKGRFLLNTNMMTAADITVASLLYPVIVPPQTAQFYVSMKELESIDAPGCSNIVQFANMLRDRYQVVRNALELYEYQRWNTVSKRS